METSIQSFLVSKSRPYVNNSNKTPTIFSASDIPEDYQCVFGEKEAQGPVFKGRQTESGLLNDPTTIVGSLLKLANFGDEKDRPIPADEINPTEIDAVMDTLDLSIVKEEPSPDKQDEIPGSPQTYDDYMRLYLAEQEKDESSEVDYDKRLCTHMKKTGLRCDKKKAVGYEFCSHHKNISKKRKYSEEIPELIAGVKSKFGSDDEKLESTGEYCTMCKVEPKKKKPLRVMDCPDWCAKCNAKHEPKDKSPKRQKLCTDCGKSEAIGDDDTLLDEFSISDLCITCNLQNYDGQDAALSMIADAAKECCKNCKTNKRKKRNLQPDDNEEWCSNCNFQHKRRLARQAIQNRNKEEKRIRDKAHAAYLDVVAEENKKHPAPENTKCDRCGRTLKTEQGLKQHKRDKHGTKRLHRKTELNNKSYTQVLPKILALYKENRCRGENLTNEQVIQRWQSLSTDERIAFNQEMEEVLDRHVNVFV